jgi:hypothetical protein
VRGLHGQRQSLRHRSLGCLSLTLSGVDARWLFEARTLAGVRSERMPPRFVRLLPCSLPNRAVHARPVARAAFFATRLTPAPVFRRVRFADFTNFVVLDFLRLVLDFLRLAILFPPVRYLLGPSPRPLCEAVIEMIGRHRLTHSTR